MTTSIDLMPLVVGGLAAVRVMAFLLALPMFGLRGVPTLVRAAIGVWIAWAVWPLVPADLPPEALAPDRLALAMAVETLVGLLLAFSVSMLFAVVQMAGQVVGVQMAFSLVNVVDPLSDAQVSATSQIYYFFAGLIFLALDGPLQLVRGVAASFAAIPPGTIALSGEAMFALVGQIGTLFKIGLQLAAPPVIALMLVSITLGIIGRTVPQLNVLVVGFPIKILVGLGVLMFGASHLGSLLDDLMRDLDGRLLDLSNALAVQG